MTTRSKIAQFATVAALVLGAGFAAQAQTHEMPVPAKLLLVGVDTSDCFDLGDGSTVAMVRSYSSQCRTLAGLMPEHRKMGLVRARVAGRLFPKAEDGSRTQAHPALSRKVFNGLDDYQITGLAYQLGVQLR